MTALLILAQEYMLLGAVCISPPKFLGFGEGCRLFLGLLHTIHLIKLITISILLHSQGTSVRENRQGQFVDHIN